MSRIIGVASVKGGVGKTTTVSNLAAALSKLGYKVLAVDANFTGANLGLHLGTSSRNILTVHDVLKRNVGIKEAIYEHPLGFHVLLGGIYLSDLKNIKYDRLKEELEKVKGEYDIILLDCSAGLDNEAISAIKASDELLIVTTPELPSVADAYKLVEFAESNWIPITGVVVNKEDKGQRYKDITIDDVEEILGRRVIEVIPKEELVGQSVNLKRPIVNLYPNSKSGTSFMRLAHQLVGKEMEENQSLIDRILSLFTKN